jgi:hypothetical protein
MPDDEFAAFRAAVDRLVRRAEGWSASGWERVAATGEPRAVLVAELVQDLARLGCLAEGVRPRRVPIGPPTSLPDQLRVVSRDLSASGDGVRIGEAAALVEVLTHQT